MKLLKILTVLLMAVLCLALASCNGGDGPTDTTPADTTPVVEETTPAPAVMVTLAQNGQTEYSVIRSEKADGGEVSLFSAFYAQLCKVTDCEFEFSEALERVEPDGAAFEILLGKTNRPESQALLDKLTAAGGTRFGISMSENKLAIVGTSTYQTYLGLDYLLNNFVTESEGGVTFEVEQGLEYISEDTEKAYFDVYTLAKNDMGMTYIYIQTLIKKLPPQKPGYSVMQGGGTDGKYAYIALINKSVTPEHSIIYKYDLATLELVKTSEPIPTCHTNDITYDSKNRRLIISRCTADDGYLGICIVDPDTLELKETVTTSVVNRAVHYIPEKDQYLFASNWTLTVTDSDFKPISSFVCKNPQYTTQGCYCDGKYTYDVRYVSKSSVHYVVIHAMSGTYMGTAPVVGLPASEPENMFVYDGRFIMGCNKTNSLYEIELLPEKWWK